MKLKFLIITALLATSALAQTPTPTADEVRTEANSLITAVRQQRDANADQLAQAMAQIAKQAKEIESLKAKAEPKKEPTP